MATPVAPLDTSFAITPISAAASSLTVPLPSCNAGHLLVMTANGGNATTIHPTVPAGWTRQSNTNARQGVWTKVATAGDATPGATVTQSFDASGALVAIVASYPAADVIAFKSTPGSTASGTSYSPVFPTGVTAAQTVLYCAGGRTNEAAADAQSGCALFNLPGAPWVWQIPPIGPSYLNAETTVALPALGLAAIAGPQTVNPTAHSAMNLDHLAAFLVLGNISGPPDWLRVTSTGGGRAGQGTALTVIAITGAAASQSGAVTATKDTVAATPDVTVTPARNGSRIYGAVYADNPGSSFTPHAGSTFDQNFLNNVQQPPLPAAYGTFRTGAQTAGVAVTVGASGPASGTGTPAGFTGTQVAAAEIIPAGAGLTEVATATATGKVPQDYQHPFPSQEAIFTVAPASGTRLVAMVANGFQSNFQAQPVMALSDNRGLTWTELAHAHGSGYAGVWTAVIP